MGSDVNYDYDYGGGSYEYGDEEECVSNPGDMCTIIKQIDCPDGLRNFTTQAHTHCVCLAKYVVSHVLINNNTLFEFGSDDYYDDYDDGDQFSDPRCDSTYNGTYPAASYTTFEEQKVYFVLFVIMCLVGIINNALSIIVLTRRHMQNPINFMLTTLAVLDALSLLFRLVYYIDLFEHDGHQCAPFSSAVLDITDIGVFYTFHVSGIWITVCLAVVRYMFVCRGSSATFSQLRAKIVVASVMGVVLVTRIPAFFFYTVHQFEGTVYDGNTTITKICHSKIKSQWARDNPSYDTFRLYYFAVVNKIIPPILLTVFFARIIYTLQTTARRRESQLGRKASEHYRTTMVLLAVVLCSIFMEMPQGIVRMINIIHKMGWNSLWLHFLQYINSSVNFYFYLAMSRKFRETFRELPVVKQLITPLCDMAKVRRKSITSRFSEFSSRDTKDTSASQSQDLTEDNRLVTTVGGDDDATAHQSQSLTDDTRV